MLCTSPLAILSRTEIVPRAPWRRCMRSPCDHTTESATESDQSCCCRGQRSARACRQRTPRRHRKHAHNAREPILLAAQCDQLEKRTLTRAHAEHDNAEQKTISSVNRQRRANHESLRLLASRARPPLMSRRPTDARRQPVRRTPLHSALPPASCVLCSYTPPRRMPFRRPEWCRQKSSGWQTQHTAQSAVSSAHCV